MESEDYIDLLNDPKTISYASPTCKKYQAFLVLLYICLLLDVVFIFVVPPFGIAALIILLILIVRLTKKLNKYLASVQEEITSSGQAPAWWNERCRQYRKLSKLPPEKRMKKIAGNTASHQETSSEKNSSNTATTAQKVIVNTAAAYGLGKAATNAINNSTPVKRANSNPRTNSAMAAREKARAGQSTRGTQSKERITSNGKTYYIKTMPNGNQALSDAGGRRLGTYYKTQNITTDGKAKKVGNGNLLRTLI